MLLSFPLSSLGFNRSVGARFCTRLCIAWVVLLPFLVPFDSFRNVDLQGLVLLLAGGCAWLAILLRLGRYRLPDKWSNRLLAIFILLCLLSLVITPHIGLNLFGVPHLRLGSLGILSCVGIGLLMRRWSNKQLTLSVYFLILLVALVSLGYAIVHYHSIHRIGGVFNQSDVFACIIGCGIILGWQLCSVRTWRGRFVLAGQAYLITLLLFSQTRAVIVLVVLLSIVSVYRSHAFRAWQLALICAVCITASLGVLALAPSSRLSNKPYAIQSTTYRLQLNQAALAASLHRPLFGYGPGNIADALDCRTLRAEALKQTCREGYYFNSSHDIYLDRVLAFGWIAGLAFIAFVGIALSKGGLEATNLAAILIALYYCTNVTSTVLEVLFWILLLRNFDHETTTPR
jgi:O-antigen ligase